MDLSLTILGTASARPTSDRISSAQVLKRHGRLFLIDCSEGIQSRMCQHHVGIQKIETIFISHNHGDHCFGLPGIVNTMGLTGRTEPLFIYAPETLKPLIDFINSEFSSFLGFPVNHVVLQMTERQVIYENKSLVVSAFPLNHNTPTYGFRFDCKPSAKAPMNAAAPGSYAYCSDTAPFDALPSYVSGVDVLYHESTYPDEMETQAIARGHSTARQAALCAKEAGVGKLILGHYSSRYHDLSIYLQQAREVFEQTYLGNDGDTIDF